jgi:predicted aspartyl protease
METSILGKVMVSAKVESIEDLLSAEKGALAPDQVRRVEVPDALVDTGATMLLMPKHLIAKLGLRPFRTRTSRSIGGTTQMTLYGPVRLTVQGRDCNLDVGEIGDEFPVLIGQIPLEALDWVVDPVGQRLIGNPDHGGEHMIDVLGTY